MFDVIQLGVEIIYFSFILIYLADIKREVSRKRRATEDLWGPRKRK